LIDPINANLYLFITWWREITYQSTTYILAKSF
jgi:hypothetical protein